MAGSSSRWHFFEESYATTFGSPGLACPMCLTGLTRESTTEDHVPPRSIGGTWTVPACDACNQRWSKAEANLARYSRRAVQNGQAVEGAAGSLKLGGTTISVIRKVVAEDFVVLRFRPNQTKAEEALSEKLKQGVRADEVLSLGEDTRLTFEESELELSFLKAGYLALFAMFGYGLVARTDYSMIREQLQKPDERVFDTMIVPKQNDASDRAIILQAVLDPPEARVLIVRFQGFLTRPGDAVNIDVTVSLPSPGEGAMDRYLHWCETLRSEAQTPITFLTEGGSIRADACRGWRAETADGDVEVIPALKASELVLPTRRE